MSFSDLMSSAKGPGVIGLLLALTVLGGFLILGTLTLDEAFQGGGRTINSVIREQKDEIDRHKARLGDLKEDLARMAVREQISKKLDIRISEIKSREESLAKAKLASVRLLEEIDGIQQALEDYKSRYRTKVRNAAKESSMEQLETLSGRVYHQVEVREVNSVGMLISHRDGSTRIPYRDLPVDMQDHFQFDLEEKERKAAAEALARKKHLRAVALAREEKKRQTERRQAEDKRAAAVRREHAIAAISARIGTLTNDISDLGRRIESESRKTISRAPQMRERLTKMRREKKELENKLRTLGAGS